MVSIFVSLSAVALSDMVLGRRALNIAALGMEMLESAAVQTVRVTQLVR